MRRNLSGRKLVITGAARGIGERWRVLPWMRRFAAEVTPALEREVAALGRHDQLVPGAETRSAHTLRPTP